MSKVKGSGEDELNEYLAKTTDLTQLLNDIVITASKTTVSTPANSIVIKESE